MSDEPTIDSVREELRGGIFQCLFMSCGLGIERRDAESDSANLAAQNFATFGVNSKLLTLEEANEWLDVAKGSRVLGDVALKYMEDAP